MVIASKILLGATFTTGQKCQESGVYIFVRHMDNSICQGSPGEKRIPLSKGETFPPHRSCSKGVIWALAQYA